MFLLSDLGAYKFTYDDPKISFWWQSEAKKSLICLMHEQNVLYCDLLFKNPRSFYAKTTNGSNICVGVCVRSLIWWWSMYNLHNI